MLYKILLSLSLVFLSVSSASAKEVDKLVGTYTANYYGGERTDRYRIEKHDNKYQLFENTMSIWKRIHKKGKVGVYNKKQFEKMMKQKVSGEAFGLNFSNRVIIFKAPKGFTIGKQIMNTGHFVFFDGVFMELLKVK